MTDITFLTNPYTSRFPSTRGRREIVRDLRNGASDVEIRYRALRDRRVPRGTARGFLGTGLHLAHRAREHDRRRHRALPRARPRREHRRRAAELPEQTSQSASSTISKRSLVHARRRHVTLAHDRPKERTRSIDAVQRQPESLRQERLKITSIADDAFEIAQRISENAAMGHDWSVAMGQHET